MKRARPTSAGVAVGEAADPADADRDARVAVSAIAATTAVEDTDLAVEVGEPARDRRLLHSPNPFGVSACVAASYVF